MTRKDYILIAEAIADCNKPGWRNLKDIAENIAHYLKEDNARFDRDRFIKACSIGEDTDNE